MKQILDTVYLRSWFEKIWISITEVIIEASLI